METKRVFTASEKPSSPVGSAARPYARRYPKSPGNAHVVATSRQVVVEKSAANKGGGVFRGLKGGWKKSHRCSGATVATIEIETYGARQSRT